MELSHQQAQEKSFLEMRARLSCNICSYKTTSDSVLKQHIKLNHENKSTKPTKSTNRKICNMCNKQFNKDTTLTKHMKNDHKIATRMEGQSVIQNLNQNQN